MNLTDSQKAAVDEIQHNLQLIACAGSGKTEVISRRIAHILASDKTVRPEEIVAFTLPGKQRRIWFPESNRGLRKMAWILLLQRAYPLVQYMLIAMGC